MKVTINYRDVDLTVKGVYTEGEEETRYDSNLEGHPGSNPEFEVHKIFVLNSDVNIISLFEEVIDEIIDLCIEEIEE